MNTLPRALLALSMSACHAAAADDGKAAKAAQASPPGWELVWSDEFDGATLDPKKWRVEDAALVKNNEKQYYSPANVRLRNGMLELLAEKKAQGGRDYTSGLVDTRDRFAMAFGRWECRAKLPKTKGVWPAIWMLRQAGGWPPEIDIMELLGHDPFTVYMSTHYDKVPHNKHTTEKFSGPDFSADFHVFACEWYPDRVDFFVDGVKHSTQRTMTPFEPFYFILNVAVGGDWPGFPDETTRLPQSMLVDWVRVYRQADAAEPNLLVRLSDEGNVVTTPNRWQFKKGDTVTLRAEPNVGAKFVRWDGLPKDAIAKSGEAALSAELTLTMNASVDITPIFEHNPDAPVLLSKGHKTTASGSENDGLGASRATDGRPGTRWSSRFQDNEWIMVDLGAAKKVTLIALNWEDSHAIDYTIEGSTDAKTWTNIKHVVDGRGGKEMVACDATARYVRLTGHKRYNQYGISLWEFGVYGPK